MESLTPSKPYNFLINASNQANLSSNSNITAAQFNSFFVFIHPYELEKMNFDGFEINIDMDDKGNLCINDTTFEAIEISPGVKIFAISKTKLER